MDSAHKYNFTFNEAISFMVQYDTQEEIEYYWENSPKVVTLRRNNAAGSRTSLAYHGKLSTLFWTRCCKTPTRRRLSALPKRFCR
jgi:hypothetical protein